MNYSEDLKRVAKRGFGSKRPKRRYETPNCSSLT